MVISDELKFPRPITVDPYKKETQVEAMDGITPVARIGKFKREWQQGRGRPRKRNWVPLSDASEASVRRLVDRINEHLLSHQILIHLVLSRHGDSFSLDVYDCTRDDVCTIIHDMVIDLQELPALLGKLQRESGIIIDTVS